MSFFSNIFGFSSQSGSASNPICSVCLAEVAPGDSFTDPSGCGHLLHLQCFMQVQSKFSACPSCRAPFKIAGLPPAPAPVPVPTRHYQNRSSRQSRPISTVPTEEPLAAVCRTLAPPEARPIPAAFCEDRGIEVVLTPEVPAVVARCEQRMFVNVSIVSQDSEVTQKSRVGVDLVMILDKSGSMSGEKESLLRNAMEFVIGELDDRDRLCTVTFNSSANYAHGFIGMGPRGQAKALETARGRGLCASGGTDIYDGLQSGMAALNARKIPNAVSTIFLLTDGIDDANLDEKMALARHARAQGWFMFIFAFGNDHNAAHLKAIADAADSSYIFIDNLATVREAFGGAIGSQQGVAGKLLNLSIQAVDSGVRIHRASAGQYASNVADDGRSAIVTYANLLVGEKRDCCVELSVPAVSDVNISTLLSATLTYTPMTADSSDPTAGDVTVISPACTITRPAVIDTPLPRNEIVDAQINRLNGISAIALATSLANENKLGEARAEVTRARCAMTSSVSATAPSTISMVAELDDCLGRLQTSHEWVSVGMAEQMESLNVHQFQRGVYSKRSRYCDDRESCAAVYSNTASKTCQKKASSSK